MSKTPKFTIYNVPLNPSRYARKATHPMVPIGITIHETDNNATARQEVAYMQRNDNWTSFHYAVDENEVIQGAPLNRNTWCEGDGPNGTGNRRTISIEICRNYRTNDLTNYRAARKRAEELVGWLMYVYGWDTSNIYTHFDWAGKNCPRVIRREGYLNTFKANALRHRNSYRDTPAPKPTTPVITGKIEAGQRVKIKNSAKQYANVNANIPAWVKNREHTVKQVNSTAAMVLLQEINSWVNINDIEGTTPITPSKPKPVAKTDLELAHEVIRGEHGNGNDRRKSLGSKYDAVQAIVNKLRSGESVAKPVVKETQEAKFDRIAREILYEKHNYGTGAERRRKLGSDYEGVQARINAILSGSASTSKPASIKVGDMVVVRRGAKSYTGGNVIPQWYTTPKVVSQINGDRAVLDIRGWATPFNIKDLVKK